MFPRHALPPRESDQRRHSQALPPANVRKRLFPTPTTSRNLKSSRPSISSSSAPHHNPNHLLSTPLPPMSASSRTPSVVSSSFRRSSHVRPSSASLRGTPSMRKRYVEETPQTWLNRQVDDLTAWLNHELGDPSESPSYFPTSAFATSDVYIAKYASILRFCKESCFKADVQRLGTHLRDAKLSFSPHISLITDSPSFEQFVTLFMLSYNATWLLLGLSVILRTNFATQIDQILQKTQNTSDNVDMAALQNQLVHHILRTQLTSETPTLVQFTLKSPHPAFIPPSGVAPVKQNGIVLHRALILILLLDQASRDQDVAGSVRFPLFKSNSSAHKSQEIIDRLSKICMNDPTPLNRFLNDRSYRLEYECPTWTRSSNFIIRDLSTDLRDGVRLCKFASLLTGDPCLLQQVKYSFQSQTSDSRRMDKHSLNVMMALDSIKTYASHRFGAKVNWNADVRDITEGNVSKTVALLWQIAELWIEVKLLDQKMLEGKLMEADDEFRTKAADAAWIGSPGAFRELSPSIKSPSRLVLYEHSDKDCIYKLLRWSATVCGIHRIKVMDFTESFRDCVVLCILLNHLHPNAVDMNFVTRVAPAEIRDEQESVRELEIVQNNIKQFEKACLRLGAMPNFSISARAALAPAFISEFKEESFGRLMILMTAYLFNRAQIRKGAKENLDYVHEFAEDWGDFVYPESPVAIGSDMAPDETVSLTSTSGERNSENEGQGFAEEGYDSNENDMPSLMVAAVDLSSPLTLQVSNNQAYSPNTGLTPFSNPEASSSSKLLNSSFCRFSSLDGDRNRKQKAAKKTLSNYKAFQARKKTMSDKESTILLQSAVRGFLARCDHESLVRRNEELAISLESKFLGRKPTLQSLDLVKQADSYNMEAEKVDASNSFRLCSKSLEDVGKTMTLLPSHFKKLEEYVLSMLLHEHQLEQTQNVLSAESESDPSRSVDSSITPSVIQNDMQITGGADDGAVAMVTIENQTRVTGKQETPPRLSNRITFSPSPGGESQVYKTPWATIRTRPRVRDYGETPSDRLSWHTASPRIGYPNDPTDRSFEALTGIDQDPSGIESEGNLETVDASDSGNPELSYDRVENAHSAHTLEVLSKGLLSSTVASISRAAFEYILNRNHVGDGIVAQAVYDADAAVQNAITAQDLPSSNDRTQTVVEGEYPRNAVIYGANMATELESTPGNTFSPDGGSAHTSQQFDHSSSPDSPGISGESIFESSRFSPTRESNLGIMSDLRKRTETGPHQLDSGPDTNLEAPENEKIGDATESSERGAPQEDRPKDHGRRLDSNLNPTTSKSTSLVASEIETAGTVSNTNASLDRDDDGDIDRDDEMDDLDQDDEMSDLDKDDDEMDDLDRVNEMDDLDRVHEMGDLDQDDNEMGNLDRVHEMGDHTSKETTKTTLEEERDDVENKPRAIATVVFEETDQPNVDTEEIEKVIEVAMSLAENAFDIHMERAQRKLEFDKGRRNAINMRYKELDQASSVSMKRLRHEEERLEASRSVLEERFSVLEVPCSINYESDEHTALLQYDSSSETHSVHTDTEPIIDCTELNVRLHSMHEEDEIIDKELSKLESDWDSSLEKLNKSMTNLMETVLTASRALAELRYTRHMNELARKRENERVASKAERQHLNDLFLKTMWGYKVALGRINEDHKEAEDAITGLEEKLDDTGSTVFQLLEADIDSKIMLVQHAEERETSRLNAYSLIHDQAWNKLLETEELIRSYHEIELPLFDEDLITARSFEVSTSAEATSIDDLENNPISLPCPSSSLSEARMGKTKPIDRLSDYYPVSVCRHSRKTLGDDTAPQDITTSPQAWEPSKLDLTVSKPVGLDCPKKVFDRAVEDISQQCNLSSSSSSSRVLPMSHAVHSPLKSASKPKKDRVDSEDHDCEEENRDPSKIFTDESSPFSSSKMYSTARRSTSNVLGSANMPLTPASPVEIAEHPKVELKNTGSSMKGSGFEIEDKHYEEYNKVQVCDIRSPTERRTTCAGRDNLEDLSVELSAFKITSSKKSVDDVMSNPSSAGKLRALIRRISTATASPVPRLSISSKRNSSMSESIVCQNIMRTVLVVMRHLHRTPAHIRLVDLGMRIVQDFCEVQNRVADLVSVENCIDVLVTCAQFYRDQENILKPAVFILRNISLDDKGLMLMRKNRTTLKRLEAVDHLLETSAEQERKNRYRVQYAKMIVEQVRLSRTSQNRSYLLRDHLAAAERTSALPELRIRPAHTVLISMLGDLKSMGVL